MLEVKKYLEKIRESFPNLKWKDYKIINHWWDHLIIIIDNKIVFRFPKEKDYKNELKKEILLLDSLQDKFSVWIPYYKYISQEKDFAWYDILHWEELGKDIFLKMDTKKQDFIVNKLSNFLSVLHSIGAENIIKFDIKAENQKDTIDELIKKLEKNVFPILKEKDILIIKQYLMELDWVKRDSYMKTLTHNDLTPEHILWDEKKHKINIIDFSDRIFWDPAIDFAWLFEYGEDFVKKVYNLYVWKKDKNFLKRAKLYFKRIPLYIMVDSFEWYPCKFKDWYKMFKERFNIT